MGSGTRRLSLASPERKQRAAELRLAQHHFARAKRLGVAEGAGREGLGGLDGPGQDKAPPEARDHQPREKIAGAGKGDGQALGRVAAEPSGPMSTVSSWPGPVSSSTQPVAIRCAASARESAARAA